MGEMSGLPLYYSMVVNLTRNHVETASDTSAMSKRTVGYYVLENHLNPHVSDPLDQALFGSEPQYENVPIPVVLLLTAVLR